MRSSSFRGRRWGKEARWRARVGIWASAIGAVVVLVLSCGDGAVEPPPPPAPVATTVAVSPGSATLSALGETARFTAEVRDQNGQVVAGAAIAWASSDISVATVDGSGLVTAAGNGTATITATAGSALGTAAVTVAQEVNAVTVSPATDTLVALGDTLRLSAEAIDANGHVVEETAFTWASADTLVAVVDSTGLVTGIEPGTVAVTATAKGVTGHADLTVVALVPTTVAVTPDTVAFTAIGQNVQLAAEVLDQARRVMKDVGVSWLSTNTAIAMIDSVGLVTAAGAGSTTVAATVGDVSGVAVVTVMQSAGSVVVSPAADTVAPGDTLRLVAEAFDANGHVVEDAEFSWSSSNGSVATVDASGLVTGLAEGTATITATAGEASGTSEITVENPDRAALIALYNATDGPNWVDSEHWLTDVPLGEWYGVDTDASGRVVRLDLRGRRDEVTGELIPHGLTGAIPSQIGRLGKLAELSLGQNRLSGPIPPELGNLASLRSLDLNRNDLTGPIPPELGNLASLHSLVLNRNDLTGPIPPELGNLAHLSRLSLYVNALSGPIPPELGDLANLNVLSLRFNDLTGSIPSDLGKLAYLSGLQLGNNDLSGPLPPELGDLSNLTELGLQWNRLSGPIPRGLLQLRQLRLLEIKSTNLCVPGVASFHQWVQGIEIHDVGDSSFCNAADVAALEALHDATGGSGWIASDSWLTDRDLEEWRGVGADSLGRVTELDLTRNGLSGQLPSDLGGLTRMTLLRIGGNALSGRLPSSLTNLSLTELHYAGTRLCAPAEASFQHWLNGISSLEGTGMECAPLSPEREILEIVYNATGGVAWTENDNWLTDAPLEQWHGVRVDGQGRVVELHLHQNNLSGPMPRELGNLTNLTWLTLGSNNLSGSIPSEFGNLRALGLLVLGRNNLTGPIPPELGNLVNLWSLDLSNSDLSGPIPRELGNLASLGSLTLRKTNLTGPIPPELGNLARLSTLWLSANALSGPIPPELGNLTGLTELRLDGNGLTGPIPPDLGNLARLLRLDLDDNELTGPLPPNFGRMSSLEELHLSHNAGLTGALPGELTALDQLDVLLASGTGLCAPPDIGFQAWLERIYKSRVASCGTGNLAAAYLVQAVQSREFPVPLVAGERALLRVFPTANRTNSAGFPEVRARFFLNGLETHLARIPSRPGSIPTEVVEGSLSASANAEVPAHVVRRGLEMVIEIDPDETLDPALGVARRIPASGRLGVNVRAMPLLELNLVPFLWSAAPDSSIMDLVEAMAADPENHEMLWHARTQLPVADIDVTSHEPVLSTSNEDLAILAQTEAIRLMEGGAGYYMGMMAGRTQGRGIAYRPGRSAFAAPHGPTVGHELGHNMSLQHAPCSAPDTDPAYPYPDGSIGAWAYDFREGGRLIPPFTKELMSYCAGVRISDYHFTNALRYRLRTEGPPAATTVASRSMLLWGGVRADGAPYLEPVFVVDAPPELPRARGEYRLTGRSDRGTELFSLAFDMPAVADGDGSSSFALLIPVRAEWEGSLAAITLVGPGGSYTLDGESDIPMAILRNPRTGQVRGFLRDLPAPTQAAMDAAQVGAQPGLEMLFSRGIPDAAAWKR